jgi:hypothetical protein
VRTLPASRYGGNVRWVDAVEKCPAVIGFAIEEAFGLAPGWAHPGFEKL